MKRGRSRPLQQVCTHDHLFQDDGCASVPNRERSDPPREPVFEKRALPGWDDISDFGHYTTPTGWPALAPEKARPGA